MNSLESFVKFIPSSNNATIQITASPVLTDMESKARKFGVSLNDALYEVSNEPSLGFYRIQEHVRKSIPALIEKSNEMETFKAKIQGNVFDSEYSIEAVVKMAKSDSNFESINRLLTDSVYALRQINIRNQKAAIGNEQKKQFTSPVQSNSIKASHESKSSPVEPSSAKSEKGFSFSNFISTKSFRTTSISENLSHSARNSPQRSQTMLIANNNINNTPSITNENTAVKNNQLNNKNSPTKAEDLSERVLPILTSSESVNNDENKENLNNEITNNETINKETNKADDLSADKHKEENIMIAESASIESVESESKKETLPND